MADTEVRFCTSCRYHNISTYNRHVCRHPTVIKATHDLVTGMELGSGSWCTIQRADDGGLCGTEARLYEQSSRSGATTFFPPDK